MEGRVPLSLGGGQRPDLDCGLPGTARYESPHRPPYVPGQPAQVTRPKSWLWQSVSSAQTRQVACRHARAAEPPASNGPGSGPIWAPMADSRQPGGLEASRLVGRQIVPSPRANEGLNRAHCTRIQPNPGKRGVPGAAERHEGGAAVPAGLSAPPAVRDGGLGELTPRVGGSGYACAGCPTLALAIIVAAGRITSVEGRFGDQVPPKKAGALVDLGGAAGKVKPVAVREGHGAHLAPTSGGRLPGPP